MALPEIDRKFLYNQAYLHFRDALRNLPSFPAASGLSETPDRVPLTTVGVSSVLHEIDEGLVLAAEAFESAADYCFRHPTMSAAGPWIFDHFARFASDMDRKIGEWCVGQRPFIRQILVFEDNQLSVRLQVHEKEPPQSIRRVAGACFDRALWMEGYIYWLSLVRDDLGRVIREEEK